MNLNFSSHHFTEQTSWKSVRWHTFFKRY